MWSFPQRGSPYRNLEILFSFPLRPWIIEFFCISFHFVFDISTPVVIRLLLFILPCTWTSLFMFLVFLLLSPFLPLSCLSSSFLPSLSSHLSFPSVLSSPLPYFLLFLLLPPLLMWCLQSPVMPCYTKVVWQRTPRCVLDYIVAYSGAESE